ncbi:MAG: hypothetical protein B1H04_03015 [Planctomycetales bacterium 4484_123]|nr:MAG: hypothetical protein B1H04_03015 [Planctomycetales bacterium 4484_123]
MPAMEPERSRTEAHWALLISGVGVLVWSGIGPRDRLTWMLEVSPVVVGGALLLGTYRRFRFSTLAYVLMWIHALILLVGGHWTYAHVPAFNWLRETFQLTRNHYDRLGHVAQGFVPAIVAREVLLRASPLRRGGWLFFIVLCVCLAISAATELVEWGAAMAMGGTAEQFLSLQGDPWDTQWDMFFAGCGAVAAQLLLARAHDRSMGALAPVAAGEPVVNSHRPPVHGRDAAARAPAVSGRAREAEFADEERAVRS